MELQVWRLQFKSPLRLTMWVLKSCDQLQQYGEREKPNWGEELRTRIALVEHLEIGRYCGTAHGITWGVLEHVSNKEKAEAGPEYRGIQ